MKGAGWLGIVAIGVGVLMIYSGYTDTPALAILRSVLRGEPLPAKGNDVLDATPGSKGESGFQMPEGPDPLIPLKPSGSAGAGSGANGGGGGGW
jgi:hypothetical protein